MREKQPGNKSFFVISNRLPVSISKRKNKLKIQESPGGLAAGLRALERAWRPFFLGWPGYRSTGEKEKDYIEKILIEKHRSYPVFLTSSDIDKYYYGFSNKTLWPLFHYFPTYCTFEESEWRTYRNVNSKFLERVVELAGPNDSFWIHDYHLMLLPAMIREVFPQSTIGFFLHIPFPSSEVFRVFPWREEILKGLLGADLIGFHTFEYARHFLSSVLRLLGYEHEFGTIQVEDRIIRVENFPMGIDFKNQEALLEKPSIGDEISSLRRQIESGKKKIILSVDRLDYTKGIPQRLEGLEYFLARNPHWHEKFLYIMLCVPSRTKVVHYSLLKDEVDSLIGRINGRFGKPGWIPIHYMYRSLPFNKLIPLYAVADVALVTPLRDGMNLVAKEYVASRKDENGVLILSETAGASAELGEALQVNVNDKRDISEAIKKALEMPLSEQKERMRFMRKRLSDYDIVSWTRNFVDEMQGIKKIQSKRIQRKLSENWQKKLIEDYKKSQSRLLLLDYDGTLIAFATKPEKAEPDTELIRILLSLAKHPNNNLVIISGRDKNTLDRWLSRIPCALVAEHGAWLKTSPGQRWEKQSESSLKWKEEVRPLLKAYEIRVPGSFVEEKEFGLAWHYRKANPELGAIRSGELFESLNAFLANTDLQVIHGNKVVEVRIGGINKGEATKKFLTQKEWDFILALGDDWTDEDIFKILPQKAYSIKVGFKPTQARFYLESPQTTRNLLREISKY